MYLNLLKKYIIGLFVIIPPLVPQIPFFVYNECCHVIDTVNTFTKICMHNNGMHRNYNNI